MFDFKTYLSTKDLPGGPVYIEEHLTAEYQLSSQVGDAVEAGVPASAGAVIGGTISAAMVVGALVYLYLAF